MWLANLSPAELLHCTNLFLSICFESLGYQARIMCSMWKESKIWENLPKVQRLPRGHSPRVSGPLSSPLHPHPDRDSCQNRRGELEGELGAHVWLELECV